MSADIPFKYNIVNGVIFHPLIDQQRIDELKDFPLRPDDIFITSFPKSGTTWTRHIVKLILNNGENDGRNLQGGEAIPWLATNGKLGKPPVDVDAMPSPRAFFAHTPHRMMPGGTPNTTSIKYIYVARNPKDVLVSLYYHFVSGKNHLGFSGTWDDLFRVFINGETYFGSWFDHVLEWWKHSKDPNVLFIKYEDMKMDLPRAVKTIAEFIGFSLKPDVIDKIVEQSTFDRMKATPTSNYSTMPRDMYNVDVINPFVRKGIVGDWKNHFTPEQSAKFDAVLGEKLKETGLDFEFGD